MQNPVALEEEIVESPSHFEEAAAQEIVRRWQEAGIDLLYAERMGENDDQPKG